MKVLKFGGSSVASADSIQSVLQIVKSSYQNGEQPLVVLSAMAGVTNTLGDMATDAAEGRSFSDALKTLQENHFAVVKQLIAVKFQNPVLTQLKLLLNELEDLLHGIAALRELSLQSKDLVLSYGERLCSYLVSKVMEQEIRSFSDALKTLQENHFAVVKQLIAVKFQNPVLTQLKLLLNELEDLLHGIAALRELSLQSKDLVLSYGERLCSYLVSKVMEQEIAESEYIDASHYVKTDSNFGNARLNETLTTSLITALLQG